MATRLESDASPRILGRAIAVGVLAGVIGILGSASFPTESTVWRQEVLGAIQRGESGITESLAFKRLDPVEASDPACQLVAANAWAAAREFEEAVRLYREVARHGRIWGFQAALGMARCRTTQGRVSQAEQHWRQVLTLDPNHIEALSQLSHLLNASGRTWEAGPFFFRLILLGKCRGDELIAATMTDRFFRDDHRLVKLGTVEGEDASMLIAVARRELYANRPEKAELLLRRAVLLRPDLGEAQGRLGRILAERGDCRHFLTWLSQLPEDGHQPGGGREHPEVWHAQGIAAQRAGQDRAAIRCFLEALRLAPHHRDATLKCALSLNRTGNAAAARHFAAQAEKLQELDSHLVTMRDSGEEIHIVRAAETLESLGRFWEAAGWNHVMSRMDIPQEEPLRELVRLLPLARRSSEQFTDNLPARAGLKVDEFPLPEWPSPASETETSSSRGQSFGAIRFREEASALGIDFQYFEGTTEENRLQHIFNVVGGGLAATDFDRDGWPDIYLAQANDWRNPASQPTRRDEIFRNCSGIRFQNVTPVAGINETSFSHGVAAGDLDSDGFPDLYVCNLGSNRLFHNLGDGTFEDATARTGVDVERQWSTSAAFADFSGDGHPDLYVANYSDRAETQARVCFDARGEQMACSPSQVAPAHGSLFQSLGDGTFLDATESSGIGRLRGRGLGLVACRIDDDSKLDLLVGNDTSENFLLINRSTADRILFEDEAVVRGVAVDGVGNAIASMGIAAADLNHDGRLDFAITNFFGSPTVLFMQTGDGYFEDATRRLRFGGMRNDMLGFGCQFADFNVDGRPDFIATNGHVDQVSSASTADRMPAQVFVNQENEFREIPGAELGAFFEKRWLGRGLATLDWNRDGLTDVGISHLHAPFALLTNESPARGSPLLVRLRGTRRADREAVGAVVTATAGDLQLTGFRLAGNGFLVTSEPCVSLTIPAGVASIDLEVAWPGGRTDRHHGLSLPLRSKELIVCEDVPQLFWGPEFTAPAP